MAWFQNYNIALKWFVCVFVDDGIVTLVILALNSGILRPVLIKRKSTLVYLVNMQGRMSFPTLLLIVRLGLKTWQNVKILLQPSRPMWR